MKNPTMLFRIKNSWSRFTTSHPKFPMFLQAASKNNVIQENTVLEIKITTPEGNYIIDSKMQESFGDKLK